MPVGPRAIGEFCWINVLSPSPVEAQAFYRELLGWEFVELPGMGHLIKVGGEDIGGIWDLNSPNTPPGTPAGIGVMVRVQSADAISARANALGGRGKEAFDVGPTGRMAEIVDPTGAMIDVWEGHASPGMTADGMAHGVPSWIELLTPDPAVAGEFYRKLFGWTSAPMPTGMPGMEYTIFSLGETMAAGMIGITPEMGNFPPHWACYMNVDDIDAAVATTKALGGTVHLEPHDIPNVGRIAGITSPHGVMFYVIRYGPM
ncbi:MAG: VOC family protein [Gemmatimonadales bacterium]|nr:VOC family protein [Gemmatimonadales bacterium]